MNNTIAVAGFIALVTPVIAWIFAGSLRGKPLSVVAISAMIWIVPALLAAYLFTLAAGVLP